MIKKTLAKSGGKEQIVLFFLLCVLKSVYDTQKGIVASISKENRPIHHIFVNEPVNRFPRALIGVFTTNSGNEKHYRREMRSLFRMDARVCSLAEWEEAWTQNKTNEQSICELIYTFVIGANESASPELVDNSRPILVPHEGNLSDVKSDVTLLNIR